MNESTHPNSTPNVARPNGDNRPRGGDISETPGTGNAPGARIVASPATAPATSSAASPTAPGFNASAAPRPNPAAGSPAPVATPARPVASPAAPSEAAPALLDKVVQGAHDTVDRLAENAAPVVQRLGEGVSATEDALHAGTDHLRQVRDEWTAGARARVRDNPLACVAGALALGALIARLRR